MTTPWILLLLLAPWSVRGASMRWKANEVEILASERGVRVSSSRSVVSGQIGVVFDNNASTCVDYLRSPSSIVQHTDDGFLVVGARGLSDQEECEPMIFSGLWSDGSQWEEGVAPGAGDDAYVQVETSTVILDSDVTVRHLFLSAGTVSLSFETECPDEWIPDPQSRQSCYAVFVEPRSWTEAACPFPSHLAHVGSLSSHELLGRLCDGRCWIGIKGDRWVREGAFFDGEMRFRRWANDTFLEEEDCGAIDAETQKWVPLDCVKTRLPFACSRRGKTISFELKASRFFWSGGSLSGAGEMTTPLVRVSSTAECFVEKAATLIVESEMLVEAGARVIARKVGYVKVTGPLGIKMEAEASLTTTRHAAEDGGALLTVASGSRLEIVGNAVAVDWRVQIDPGGQLVVDGGSLTLAGGGVAAGAALDLKNPLTISNRSLELRGPTTDSILLFSDAFVVREDVKYHPDARYGTADFVRGGGDDTYYKLDAAQDLGPTVGIPVGVYALELADGTKTACLAWHASAQSVKEALESVVDAIVDVTRYGDASRRWQYGYEYVIRYYQTSPLDVSVSWCTDASPLVRRSETPTASCKHGEPSFATLQSEPLCVADANIQVARTVAGDATMASCSLNDVTGGRHLYPSSSCDLRIRDGAIVEIASDVASFQAVEIAAGGSLFVTTRAASTGTLSLDKDGLLRLSLGNNVSIAGAWIWTGGTVEGNAVVTAQHGVDCSSFTTFLSEVRLVVKADSNWHGSTMRLRRGATIEIEEASLSLLNFSIFTANDESWLDVRTGGIINAASSMIAVPLRNRGSVACENVTLSRGGDGEGSWHGSISVAGGQLDLESAHSISGRLRVETNGQVLLSDHTSVPLVVASGGNATVRGKHVRVEGSVTVENRGMLTFTAPAANITMMSTISLSGWMSFPIYRTDAIVRRFHADDRPRNSLRSLVVAHEFFTFASGRISGNVDFHLRADSVISGQPILSDAAFLVSHANSVLHESLELLAYRGGYFENRDSTFDEARTTQSIFLRQPDPGARWWPAAELDELGQIEFEDNMLRGGRKVELTGDDSLYVPK